jgi:hypothetical protein
VGAGRRSVTSAELLDALNFVRRRFDDATLAAGRPDALDPGAPLPLED